MIMHMSNPFLAHTDSMGRTRLAAEALRINRSLAEGPVAGRVLIGSGLGGCANALCTDRSLLLITMSVRMRWVISMCPNEYPILG